MGARPNSQLGIQFSLIFDAFILCFFFLFWFFSLACTSNLAAPQTTPWPRRLGPSPPPPLGAPEGRPRGPGTHLFGAANGCANFAADFSANFFCYEFPTKKGQTKISAKIGAWPGAMPWRKNWRQNWRIFGGMWPALSACFHCRLGDLLNSIFWKIIFFCLGPVGRTLTRAYRNPENCFWNCIFFLVARLLGPWVHDNIIIL